MKKQISEHAAAAKMIRAELKRHDIKARVRSSSYSGGNSVDVYLEESPPEWVEAYVKGFQYGHFDGMADIYEYSNRNPELPQVKFAFVHVDRHF